MARGLRPDRTRDPGVGARSVREAEGDDDDGGAGSGHARPDRRRRRLWLALVLGVLAVHGWVTFGIADRLASADTDRSMPARMEVTYVRQMQLAAPPPTAALAAPPTVVAQAATDSAPVLRRPEPTPKVAKPKPKPKPKPAKPPKVAKAASAPEPASEAVAVADSSTPPKPAADDPDTLGAAASAASTSQVEPAPTTATPSAASAPSPAASSAGVPFDWPASTRLSYALTGNYRGEVQGSAQVEWVRSGSRYQVHVDFLVGPDFAPLITQRSSSDGAITAAGLAPYRYDQDVRLLFTTRPRQTVLIDNGYVVLANGDVREAPPGLQDTASQFVQLAYLFGTRPDLLQVGGSVQIPLALPKRVALWTYDVVAKQVLQTGFGPVEALHLAPHDKQQRAGSLSVEMWLAPQLRYLPVRLRFGQDDQTYVDLLLSKPPEIAG